MLEDELMIGDVIFFIDSNGIPHHVAIYAGKREDTHFISHAVSAPYYSFMTTRLKPEFYPYRVFRPTNTALGISTAIRMSIWSKYQVPFSEEKHTAYEDLCDNAKMTHPKDGGHAQQAFAAKYFDRNFYRYIAFAAHPSMPYYPEEEMEGMRCSEGLTAAFNVETLLTINAVRSCAELNTKWVSDQIPLDEIASLIKKVPNYMAPSSNYLEYINYSHHQNEYEFANFPSNLKLHKFQCIPSILAWRYEVYGRIEHFIEHYDFPLRLDSKISSPWAMMYFFQQTPNHWIDLGNLAIEHKFYNLEALEADKEKWREYINNLFSDAIERQQMLCSTFGAHSPISPSQLLSSSAPCRSRSASVGEPMMSLLETQHVSSTASTQTYEAVLPFVSPTKIYEATTRTFTPGFKRAKRILDFDSSPENSSKIVNNF